MCNMQELVNISEIIKNTALKLLQARLCNGRSGAAATCELRNNECVCMRVLFNVVSQ